MNSSEMTRLLDSISRERNVEKEVLLTDLEQALVSAARKHFNAVDTEDFTCEIDRLSGKIAIFREQEEIPLEELGRIPAQTAKQVMIQRFREDERASIYNEFIDRVGELTTGLAQRYEGGALVVQLSRAGGGVAEGFMPRSEQIPGEQHQPGERVRCLILDVREAGNQVKIVLSRATPEVGRRLFEVEVPEVAERIIEIKAMAREPGHRTKIAVASIDSKVDAVGACVGVRGSRIKNIVDELGGEKIDIVRWNESSQILIQNSLKPAEVVEISLCFELGRATVVVNEDQLSLAIGKRGQNVRLGARLTNWDIDILTPAEFTKSLEIIEETFSDGALLDEQQIDRLAALGVISVFDMEEVGPEYLAETLELDAEAAEQVVAVASEKAKVVAEQQQKEKEEAEKRKAEEAAAIAAMPGADQAAAILGDILGGGALEQAEASEGAEASDDDAGGVAGATDEESDDELAAHDSPPNEEGRTVAEAEEEVANHEATGEATDDGVNDDDEGPAEQLAEHTEADAGAVASDDEAEALEEAPKG